MDRNGETRRTAITGSQDVSASSRKQNILVADKVRKLSYGQDVKAGI